MRNVGRASGERRLTAAQELEFDRHASRLGHDTGRLRGGAELVSYPGIPSVAGLRALCAATPGQRGRRQQAFFSPAIEVRRSLGQGVHDRLEAAIYADGAIDPADEARSAAHFPFPTRILSVRHKTVRAGECWDLSVRGGPWGLDDRDDIMNVVNVGGLRIEPGATVVVRGNLFVFIVQQLTCESGEGAAPYQLAVLPTPFPVDGDTGPFDGPGGPAWPGRAAVTAPGCRPCRRGSVPGWPARSCRVPPTGGTAPPAPPEAGAAGDGPGERARSPRSRSVTSAAR